jgi:hypothetical protein
LNLETELRALPIEWPAQEDLVPALRARLAANRPPPYRRRLVLAVALMIVAIGIALAVPPARSSLLRWLGLEGVTIEYIDRLPSVPGHRTLPLGPPVTLAEAKRDVPWRILTSNLLGKPNEVRLLDGQLALVYKHANRVKLLVTQAEGFGSDRFIDKLIESGTQVDTVSVNGKLGYFLFGDAHFFLYQEPSGRIDPHQLYLAHDTLIWESGPLTLRVEGKMSREQAVEIARSFR